MNRKIFHTILRSSRAFWVPISVCIILQVFQIFIGNYTFVAFQRLIDQVTSTRELAVIIPLLAWYIGTNLLNHVLIYMEGIPAAILDRGGIPMGETACAGKTRASGLSGLPGSRHREPDPGH